jgi:hypothetical protein
VTVSGLTVHSRYGTPREYVCDRGSSDRSELRPAPHAAGQQDIVSKRGASHASVRAAMRRVIDVHDRARKRGDGHGAIVRDWEGHRIVDVLPVRRRRRSPRGRHRHPSIQIIARGRRAGYWRGATDGCPRAIQIGDRYQFQGQQAPIAVYLVTASSHADTRGCMKFLYSLDRLSVALRARNVSAPSCGKPSPWRDSSGKRQPLTA